MFGVLGVQGGDGRIGYLRAFSGMLDGGWEVEGFVPPLFDRVARDRVERPGEAKVKALLSRYAEMESSPMREALRLEQEAVQSRHAAEFAALRARHEANRKRRHAERAALDGAELSQTQRRQELQALEQESRADKAERRRLGAAHQVQRGSVDSPRLRFERRLRALERLRQGVCRALMKQVHDTYSVPNAKGERRLLRSLYAPREPPSGAGDCAAPKLLAFAHRHSLRPLAIAEFWWGAPPPTGGRVAGRFYAACRGKCGPLLPFMLEGLPLEPARAFTLPSLEKDLPILFEDDWLIVVAKPHGLLSVPGRDSSPADTVVARLRARSSGALEPLLAHRLDLDTSGLLIAAKDLRTLVALQRQFARREVRKRYVAWVEGRVAAGSGTIELPIRADIDDRPRQIHDPVHGRAALTRWQVLERVGDRTRVALFPSTGRTHQLRIHAAHPLGLSAPIVGDRLYGQAGTRLLLHAEALTFTHPGTGRMASFESPAPF